ncbi:MAG: HAD family hydrolase [Lentisphaerae bacterium]|jgi:FMN phosphatase YigB (HAD superfamily)|nr:HAD family hydrolase [Lentisphaerota bacterium]
MKRKSSNYLLPKALLIDIDDTLIGPKPGANPPSGISGDWTSSLMSILPEAGKVLGGLTAEEAGHRIKQVCTQVEWWHWSDFIKALEIDDGDFWNYAHEMESAYLDSTGTEVRDALLRLRSVGFKLYITSNNPNDGIRHKLKLGNLWEENGEQIFSRLLGVSGFRAMKWERAYWQKILQHVDLAPDEVAVIGDSLHDDFEVPHSAGIRRFFIIDRTEDRSASSDDTVTYVRNFTQIADMLTACVKPDAIPIQL